MSTTVMQEAASSPAARPNQPREVTVISHSPIFYWWPVWAVGYLFAILTAMQGQTYQFQDTEVLIHPSRTLGVVFTMIFTLVILMTHFSVRGVASITVIVSIIAVIFIVAYFGWWDYVLNALGNLAIFMNLGFYVFFSSAIFLLWAMAVFVFDRATYWVIRPGQIVKVTLFGSGEETYDTHGTSIEKKRDDLFRHWILGLGSADMYIAITGARKATFTIPNVLFIGSKLEKIQALIALKPDQLPSTVLTAGDPV